jgi:hypothetical protein
MCTTHATLPTRTATLQNGYARGLASTLSWANGSIVGVARSYTHALA